MARRSNGHIAAKAKRTKRPSIGATVAAADTNAKGKKGSCKVAGDNQANYITAIRKGGRVVVSIYQRLEGRRMRWHYMYKEVKILEKEYIDPR